jgi:Na+/proline symporter
MLQYLKELSDFGLLILIWLVQLIIYPSFTYMDDANLSAWHPKYTNMISVVVMPLMLIQLFSTFYLTYNQFNWILVTQCILIILLWTSTFFQAVPLHNQIDSRNEMQKAAIKLVQANWKRTIMWTLIVILNFIGRIDNIR